MIVGEFCIILLLGSNLKLWILLIDKTFYIILNF